MMKHEAQKCDPIEAISVDAEYIEAEYEIPCPPATQQPAAVGSGGRTEGEEDVVYNYV